MDKKLNDFVKWLGINYRVRLVEHPQTNRQAKVANKVILAELKKKLGLAKGKWAKELLEVLWGIYCTPQATTKETPFQLTYGTDALIPVEVGEPSFRQLYYNKAGNINALKGELDLIEKTKDQARITIEACKQRMVKRFNSKPKPREFLEEALVWRVQGDARKDSRGGLRENLINEASKLEELFGKLILCTWNSTHLKFYYN